MDFTSRGYIRPKVKKDLDDSTMDTIRHICPGIRLTGPNPAATADNGFVHDIFGPVRTLYRGWSTDDELRFHAAAGGVMSGLGCYLLETGKVDAIVHVRANAEKPMETDALASRTVEDVKSGVQSRYGPAAPLVHVMRLLDQGIRFAVTGKPCDISAIRNLAEVDPRVDRQVPYLISNFCGGVVSVRTSELIAGYHGVAKENVKLFRWRGDGWPGPTRVVADNGEVYDLNYEETYYDDRVPWTYDINFRCKLCVDAVGEQADISCPDAWIMVDGKPVHEEAPGANLLIARTKAGEDLVAEASAAGAIHLDPFSVEQLEAQHADQYSRKLENPGRLRGMEQEGEPTPDFDGYRADRMIELAGPERDRAAEEGARQRIRVGANLEPIA